MVKKRISKEVLLVLLMFLLIVTQVSSTESFEIQTINGEDADKVNEIEIGSENIINIKLSGADIEEGRYVALIGNKEHRVRTNGDLVITDTDLEKKVYTLELEKLNASEHLTSETQVEVVSVPRARDFDSNKEDRDKKHQKDELILKDFSIVEVDGQKTDNIELDVNREEEIPFELVKYENKDGVRLNASIGNNAELILPGEELELSPRILKDLSEGVYKLQISKIYRDQKKSDTVEVKVINDRDRNDNRDRNDDRDRNDNRDRNDDRDRIDNRDRNDDRDRIDNRDRNDDRRTGPEIPEYLKKSEYQENWSINVEEMKVDENDDRLLIKAPKEAVGDEKVTVGNSIKDLVEIEIKANREYRRFVTGVKFEMEQGNPEDINHENMKIYDVIKVEGGNLEILNLGFKHAVKNSWANKHGIDKGLRNGGGRSMRNQPTQVQLYHVEDDWNSIEGRLIESTPTHSIYEFYPYRHEQRLKLKTGDTNTLVVGANPNKKFIYAIGLQSQCKSFKDKEEIPSGWQEINESCAAYNKKQKDIRNLKKRINSLKQDIKKNNQDSKEYIEKLDKALKNLKQDKIEKAETIYSNVREESQKGFLRRFIIETVQEYLPFLN